MLVTIFWLIHIHNFPQTKSVVNSEFLCRVEEKFIPEWKVCDGVIDCRKHGEDELNCESWTMSGQCGKGFWKCANNKQCIRLDDVCNGKNSIQCFDQSDESFETCTAWNCDPDLEWKCPTHECIPINLVCDGREWWLPTGCQNMAEEEEAHCINWTCAPGRSANHFSSAFYISILCHASKPSWLSLSSSKVGTCCHSAYPMEPLKSVCPKNKTNSHFLLIFK